MPSARKIELEIILCRLRSPQRGEWKQQAGNERGMREAGKGWCHAPESSFQLGDLGRACSDPVCVLKGIIHLK